MNHIFAGAIETLAANLVFFYAGRVWAACYIAFCIGVLIFIERGKEK